MLEAEHGAQGRVGFACKALVFRKYVYRSRNNVYYVAQILYDYEVSAEKRAELLHIR